jgi:Ni,Fe-hydrogenase III small subunit
MPGAIERIGAGVPGLTVVEGIGAVVAAGEGFAGGGMGVAFAGAGVAIGIPGIGAIAGCAARPGDIVRTMKTAAAPKRVASKRTFRWEATYYAP